MVTVRRHINGLTHGGPNFYGKGSQPLLWAGSCAARGKIGMSGITRLNFYRTAEPGYNDIGLCGTPSIASGTLLYQIISYS